MNDHRFWRIEPVAGAFLVLGFATNIIGVVMFSLRDRTSSNPAPSFAYYAWERGFFMTAVVLTAIGFMLLDERLHTSDGRVLARIGAATYLFAAILGVAAEALDLSGSGQSLYPLIVVHVVLAFLGQAAIGGALSQSRLVAPWIGWATIIWNLAWLVVLPIITPRDIYFPGLHALMPLLIGIPLLRKALVSQSLAQQTEQRQSRVVH